MTHAPTYLQGFARGFIAYGASEVAAKASRLMVVVVVARSMDIAQIGVAAAAMATGDILKALTENGVGQRIIAARREDLAATCNTASRIFWIWCGGLFAVQMGIAALLAMLGQVGLAGLLALLAVEYLFMPAGLVQAALAMREGKLQQTAAIAGGQIVGANLMTAVLALVWPSALALVLPRVLAAPIWLIAMRRLRPWRRDVRAGFTPVAPFLRFGWAILGVEVVKVLRLQGDKILIGLLMGAEALGAYFMAFNAGLSLATSFSQAFSVVLFPYLCAASDRTAALRHGMTLSLGVAVPVVIAQAVLAPVYVPLLLGTDWAWISGVVSILCLAAIPSLIWTANAGRLRAEGRPETEFMVMALLAVLLMVNTVLLAPVGLVAVAWGYLAVCSVVMIAASWPAVAAAYFPKLVRS